MVTKDVGEEVYSSPALSSKPKPNKLQGGFGLFRENALQKVQVTVFGYQLGV